MYQATNNQFQKLIVIQALKEANTNLEFKIKGWHNKQEPGSDHDYSPYFRTIEDLRNKILSATVDNANLILRADNTRLTSEDFKSKFEMEQALRIYVEADICSLYKVLDEVAQARVHLERQLQLLTEELLQLKKKHKEEMRGLQNQMGREITVEIDATPGIDLTKTLAEKCGKCESLIEKNQKDIEQWFINKISFLWMSGDRDLTPMNHRRCIRVLPKFWRLPLYIFLIHKKATLEDTMADTECPCTSLLGQMQGLITSEEENLAGLRWEMEHQNHTFKILFDIKTHLEQEIMTYCQLLEV
ncbi:keratin, type I cytoskeletal 14-like [Liasis olivaceus]